LTVTGTEIDMIRNTEFDWYLRHEWQRRLNRPPWLDESRGEERSTEVRPRRRSGEHRR
jgi:hypothetical protein